MASSLTPRGTAFLVENPDPHTEGEAAATLAAEEAEAGGTDGADHCGTAVRGTSTNGAPCETTIGTLHKTPIDPYQESDKAVANERHDLEMQYQALTKGYADADGAILGEVDAQMEAVHETYASYNASGSNSAALKSAIAQQDAEVKQRIERHAGGAPLLEGYVEGKAKQPTEADALLQRMAELDAATKRAIADYDRIPF